MLVIAAGGRTAPWFILAWGVGGVAGGIAGFFQFHVPVYKRGEGPMFVHTWPFSRWLLADFLTIVAADQTYLLLVAALLGQAAFGSLKAALSLMGPTAVILLTGGNLGLPTLARANARRGLDGLVSVSRRLTRLVGAAVFGYCAFVFVAGPWLLRVVYGPEFASAGNLARIGALTYAVAVACFGAGIAIRVTRQTRRMWTVRLGVTAFSAAAVLALSAAFGLAGAAWAGTITAAAGTISTILVFRSYVSSARRQVGEPAAAEPSRQRRPSGPPRSPRCRGRLPERGPGWCSTRRSARRSAPAPRPAAATLCERSAEFDHKLRHRGYRQRARATMFTGGACVGESAVPTCRATRGTRAEVHGGADQWVAGSWWVGPSALYPRCSGARTLRAALVAPHHWWGALSRSEGLVKVVVFGLGYVGTVTAACLAAPDRNIVGVDPDDMKVELVRAGRSPVVEPGLGRAAGRRGGQGLGRRPPPSRARRSTGADVALLCVGTPSRMDGSVNLAYIERAAAEIGEFLRDSDRFLCVVVRSTVPPGTVLELVAPHHRSGQRQASPAPTSASPCAPSSCAKARAWPTSSIPPFIAIGAEDARTESALIALFSDVDRPVHVTAIRVAEGLKYACNAYHAVKISFVNEIGRLCQAVGIDTRSLMTIFSKDDRLNISTAYLRPGFAYGGSCLPKDLRALHHLARQLNVDTPLLVGTSYTNDLVVRELVRLLIDLPTARRRPPRSQLQAADRRPAREPLRRAGRAADRQGHPAPHLRPDRAARCAVRRQPSLRGRPPAAPPPAPRADAG